MPAFRNVRAAALPAKLSRSWLLASAADEANFAPALASEADSVVFDMEDAVPAPGKAEARERVVEALSTGMTAWVRVNGMETEYWAEDLAALSRAPGLRGVMLAMTERPEQVTHTAMRLQAGTPVLALIESAVGIENATAIAKAPGTFRLAFGVGDFRRDTGASDDPMALAYARSKLVVASRVGQLPGPIDGPTVGALGDELLAACKVTASMGMTGKLCLMVEAADTINKGLSPSESEIRWAHELLNAHAAGAVVGDGSYLPRLARAEKISALADSYGLWNA
ncbi:HpcH/HpaI aldolase/citrate lyase family protein [Arthrobacter mobilis]|uniref:CoA ester lyase n=1 Tax=Arthrobacter mobilis TaxID=2724944 RepID=A0A7X6HFE3_9MICC|nr:aldolase/citrate lyase family protein [Arthrobacter mobilis]NKX54677.1 CoA ester lyase [Arthrobacter mobilis]